MALGGVEPPTLQQNVQEVVLQQTTACEGPKFKEDIIIYIRFVFGLRIPIVLRFTSKTLHHRMTLFWEHDKYGKVRLIDLVLSTASMGIALASEFYIGF